VELSRAVAAAEAGEVEAALALAKRLELDSHHYLRSTRAELLRRLDRVEDARAVYDCARLAGVAPSRADAPSSPASSPCEDARLAERQLTRTGSNPLNQAVALVLSESSAFR
jgi:hypothetical protein